MRNSLLIKGYGDYIFFQNAKVIFKKGSGKVPDLKRLKNSNNN